MAPHLATLDSVESAPRFSTALRFDIDRNSVFNRTLARLPNSWSEILFSPTSAAEVPFREIIIMSPC
jgi:hypothetical protein